MRSYPSIRHRRLCGTRIPLPVIITALLTLTTLYISTTSFTAEKPRETYVSPTARAILTSHNRAINKNPTTSKKVIIYRSLGNSLPPRHASNQTYKNLLFTLLHEPELPHVEKRWYINRLLDAREEASIINLLLAYRHKFFVDSLNWRDYKTLTSRIDRADRVWSTKRVRRFAKRVPRAWMQLLRHKALFVMHCNAARNSMLELGFSAGAEFVLPADGNIFFTHSAWGDVISNIGKAGYYAVPMVRIARNSDLGSVDEMLATEEPQILFRRDAIERFDERRVYGQAPKLNLLERLSERRLLRKVGWCVRLADGSGGVMNGTERAMNRYEGVERALALADWMAFSGPSSGHGFDIGRCVMKLRGLLHLGEELFQQFSLRDFGEMQESDVCHWTWTAIYELPLNESRTLTDPEKVRMIILLELLITHPETECTRKKMVLVSRWCRGYVGIAGKWEAGWWVLGRGLDGLLAAFGGVLIGDYRLATRVGSAVRIGNEEMAEAGLTEWVACVEQRIAWRVGSGGGKYAS